MNFPGMFLARNAGVGSSVIRAQSQFRSDSKRRTSSDCRQLGIEELEQRTLLSGTVQPLDPMALSGNTGEKPQSKIWSHDNQWWSVLANTSGTYVWRLDGSAWTSVLKLSGSSYRADAKEVGDVTHVLLYKSTSTKLASLQYVPGSPGTYQLWSQQPSLVSVPVSTGVETATIDLDCTGRMWMASDGVAEIEVRYSDLPYTSWSAPVQLATNVSSDDIGAVTALPNCTVGVLWSNQTTQRFGFRLHVDGTDPSNWSADEVPASQSALNVGAGMADDHVNLSVASDSTLYAAVKTSYDKSGYPKIALIVRRPNGTWDPLYQVDQAGTRPSVLLNESEDRVLVAYTKTDNSNDIVYRDSPMTSISFGTLQTLITGTMNNVSSTKQNYTNEVVFIADTPGTVAGAKLITGSTQNLAPQVGAGPDQTIDLSTLASLNGTVSDDGLPNPPATVTTSWTKVSGPGSVSFGNASAVDTTAGFSLPGTYVLRLTANDTQLQASDDVIIVAQDNSGTTTLMFQDGMFPTAPYAGTRDTKLSSSNPTINYGSATSLRADGSPDETILVKWDTSSVPAGSVVQSASLTFKITNATVDSYEIYEMMADWDEVTTNWTMYSSTGSWELAGAQGPSERGTSVLGTLAASLTGFVTVELNAAGVALVQSWIDNPLGNFGLIIQDYASASDGVSFNTSETSTASNRPKLTIRYLPTDSGDSGIAAATASREVQPAPSIRSASINGKPVERDRRAFDGSPRRAHDGDSEELSSKAARLPRSFAPPMADDARSELDWKHELAVDHAIDAIKHDAIDFVLDNLDGNRTA